MSRLEDVFLEEDREDDDILERVIEGGSEINSDGDDIDNNDHSEAEEAPEAPKRIDPTEKKEKRVVRNPQVVLNPKRLTGPRGIKTIPEFFKDFKFQGKGHEKEDLDFLMKKLEHWAHRLYPKFQFDDCLNKIAALGAKKEVCVHIKKIRLDMVFDDQVIRQSDNEEENDVAQNPVRDEFDLLLDQQIALARSTPASMAKTVIQYDDSINDSASAAKNSYFPRGDNSSSVWDTLVTPNKNTAVGKPGDQTSGISQEQRERMLKNRMIAEEKRLARMKENAEKKKAEAAANIAHDIPSQNTSAFNTEVEVASDSTKEMVGTNQSSEDVPEIVTTTELNDRVVPTSQELMDFQNEEYL